MYKEQFQDLAGPRQGQVFERDHSLTAARFETPKQWLGGIVTFISTGAKIKVATGGPGVMVDASARAIVNGETIAPHWGSGMTVPDGGVVPIPFGLEDTHFSVDSDVANGSWCAFLSSGYPDF